MVERSRHDNVAARPWRRQDNTAATALRVTLIRVREETSAEATLPLISKPAENSFATVATLALSRATLRLAEMTALASSTARAGVGAERGAEGIMERVGG